MQLSDNDLSYFLDIYECIIDIINYTKDISFREFETDKMRRLAVERQLEVIGQAANKISSETQTNYHSVPWGKVIGLRNKLAHDYGEILAKRIWDISKKSIPELLNEILQIPDLNNYFEKEA